VVISEGDIRRKIVGGMSIDSSIETAANRKFSYVAPGDSRHKILRQFDKRVTNLPVLNHDDCLIDLLCRISSCFLKASFLIFTLPFLFPPLVSSFGFLCENGPAGSSSEHRKPKLEVKSLVPFVLGHRNGL